MTPPYPEKEETPAWSSSLPSPADTDFCHLNPARITFFLSHQLQHYSCDIGEKKGEKNIFVSTR